MSNKKNEIFEGDKFRVVMYIAGIALAVSIIVFVVVFLFYNNTLDNEAELSLMEMGAATNTLVPNPTTNELAEASITEDKNIEQVKNSVKEQTTKTPMPTLKETTMPGEAEVEETSNNETEQNETEKNNIIEENIKFEAPVSGEILTDYAEDTLVYSGTLAEWTTHLGIDIKAKRTTVVKAAADGKVESIKNDPRYGLTITITHANGFKTIYSNLLTTEFVSEGEEVECGQTIATVGETAAFEIADESHLHFEILKDNKNVNPTIYLK